MAMSEEAKDRIEVPIVRWKNGESVEEPDIVSVEEPLEIFVDGEPFYLTMRSPGDDIPLVAGLCFGEGIIESMDDLASVGHCEDTSANHVNVFVSPERRKEGGAAARPKRMPTYSSCGICGKDLIEDIAGVLTKIKHEITIPFSRLIELREELGANQYSYNKTGGTHAAAVFSREGRMLAISEDVGRHNALDKSIGKVLLAGARKEASIALLSSRLSYEMVQKAARFGIEILAGVSAPTSLGIELARSINLTLIGFLRSNRGNIYTCPERVLL